MRLPVSPSYEENIWDHAAGALLVEEAGGKVCDARQMPLDFTQGRSLLKNKGVIASNSELHESLMKEMKETMNFC
jgi:3'(2'), 5'-bisphosphate nucleotidase